MVYQCNVGFSFSAPIFPNKVTEQCQESLEGLFGHKVIQHDLYSSAIKVDHNVEGRPSHRFFQPITSWEIADGFGEDENAKNASKFTAVGVSSV